MPRLSNEQVESIRLLGAGWLTEEQVEDLAADLIEARKLEAQTKQDARDVLAGYESLETEIGSLKAMIRAFEDWCLGREDAL